MMPSAAATPLPALSSASRQREDSEALRGSHELSVFHFRSANARTSAHAPIDVSLSDEADVLCRHWWRSTII